MVAVEKAVEVAAATKYMKNLLLPIFLVAMWFNTVAQQVDSVYTKKAVRSTQFEYLLSYYQQDGNHSAVTGGIGTEKLTVFINKVNITHVADSFNTFLLEGGIDIISSASTDNIDMRVSSASAEDNRLWVSVGYQRNLPKKHVVGVKPSFSIESDYLSWGFEGWWSHQNKPNRRYGVNVQLFADDLRWGRFNDDYKAPVTVVYPKELRDSVWFDVYMRYSYNLVFSLQHDINKRMNIGFFPGIVWQEGLLSTPFHRFYFKGAAEAVVENLPQTRLKIPLGVQLNTFIGNRTILQAYYRFYWDNFGINAHTFNLEMPIKVLPHLKFAPFFRLYTQQKSTYFYPYQTALSTQPYFTSDYDLSGFTSVKGGVEFDFIFVSSKFFNQIALRYSYYARNDGLHFNQLSSYLSIK